MIEDGFDPRSCGQCRCQLQELVRENPKFARSRHVVRRKTAVDARVLSDIVKRRSIQALPVT
jgi:hypothetical protein